MKKESDAKKEEESENVGGGVADDKYDVEAAEALANDARNLSVADAVPIYERLVAAFPTSAKFWKQYVEAQMVVNKEDAVKQVFARCLLNCLHIPLWRCYIRFIKKVNEKKGADGFEETRKAFDFTVNYVGTDISSGPIWIEYIDFLKSRPVMTTQEESQRMTAVRKVYQRAILTPSHHIEQLWKDYENFENSVSRALAKGLISEYQPKFNSARAVYKERKKYIDEIDWNMLAIPPTGSCKEEQQYMAWKRLLAFDKGNPQRIDSASSMKRITFTYEQCLMYLYHYPDIWYDYATWHTKSGSVDSAVKLFQRALKALPESESLRYGYAELEESRGAVQSAKKIYENLLTCKSDSPMLAAIQYIRFLRRTEGVEAARKYFLEVRKLPECTYHAYVAYAMMEFCLNKDSKVANNIFEFGLKKFMHEPRYILEYADFLCRLNDDRNVRALFERALSSIPPEDSSEVWKRFLLFEQAYGDLASIMKVERRKKEALAGSVDESSSALDSSLYDVISRYSYMDLWPCSSEELDHLSRQEWIEKNADKKADNRPALAQVSASIVSKMSTPSTKITYPDTSRMITYNPAQVQASADSVMREKEIPAVPGGIPPAVPWASAGARRTLEEIIKMLPPTLATFISQLPVVEGPFPNPEVVLSVLLQGSVPSGPAGKAISSSQRGPTGPSASDPAASASSQRLRRDAPSGKRKDQDRQEDDDTMTVQSRPLPQDVFKIRQIRRARGVSSSQTGSVSASSAFSGDLSGSTG
ncbi:tetratricopeptide repeat (TPR)-like superfamily protein isoform X2 [Wolffia australiana]